MIKILPIKENNKTVEPYYRLKVTLGYGEHCDDTTSESWMEINDEKVEKYSSLSEEEMDEMDWLELRNLEDCITQKEAEKIVLFFDSLWKKKNKDGYQVNHIIINDGPDEFWWKEQGAMTDKEFDWFSGIYNEYECDLFNPQVEHNWCGIVNAKIEYIDENNKIHKCEVI